MTRNGAIYIRVSTDRQEELSPDAQRRLLLDYAASHDIIVAKEYIFQDNGISGRNAQKRPEFQRMIGLAKSKDHPIDCIVVWKFSRFARNQEESILYKSLLKKNDVEVISVTEDTTGEFGSLIERIIEWMDEYYSIRLSGEVIRGMTENAMRGNYQAAPPIGYLYGGDKQPPVIDPDTVIIPRTIHDMFLSGATTLAICRHCNLMGWRTKRGNQFDVRHIEYILSNPFYAGMVRWNYSGRGRKRKDDDEVIIRKGKHEPLWSFEDYELFLKRLSSRRSLSTRDIASCKHWLSGVLRCSACGRSLSFGGKKLKGFQCWGYTKGLCDISHYMNADVLETNIILLLKGFLQSDNIPYEVVHVNPQRDDQRLSDLNAALDRISSREQRAREAFLDGIDSKEEYRANKERLAHDREEIEGEIARLSGTSDAELSKEELDQKMIDTLQDVVRIVENPDIGYEEKGEAIRVVVDRIVFDRPATQFHAYLRLQL